MLTKTISQLRKEALAAPQFVMHTNEFGFDMFVADESKSGGCPMTDKIEEAIIWADGFDDTKLMAQRFITGYNLIKKFI